MPGTAPSCSLKRLPREPIVRGEAQHEARKPVYLHRLHCMELNADRSALHNTCTVSAASHPDLASHFTPSRPRSSIFPETEPEKIGRTKTPGLGGMMGIPSGAWTTGTLPDERDKLRQIPPLDPRPGLSSWQDARSPQLAARTLAHPMEAWNMEPSRIWPTHERRPTRNGNALPGCWDCGAALVFFSLCRYRRKWMQFDRFCSVLSGPGQAVSQPTPTARKQPTTGDGPNMGQLRPAVTRVGSKSQVS